MLTEGSKAIYCLGDKEEIVDVIKIHPDSITIFIPSIGRERDTLPEKLKPMVEKKLLLELPEKEPLMLSVNYGVGLNIYNQEPSVTFKKTMCKIINHKYKNITLYNENVNNINELLLINSFTNNELFQTICDLYKEVVNLEERDKVLLENQQLLLNQLNSLQETVKILKKRDEERDTVLWTMIKAIKDQKTIHELELKELRKLLKTEEPKPLPNSDL
jgi:hypothetical protein